VSVDTGSKQSTPRRAWIVGLGLIGGSLGLRLRQEGWWVAGTDIDEGRAERALGMGAVDAVVADGESPGGRVDLAVACTPASEIVAVIEKILNDARHDVVVVTDVGGVKSEIVGQLDQLRYIGGHPMAGSEAEGLDGADAGLFEGAIWVLTPSSHTPENLYQRLASAVACTGAEVVALSAERHDELVALVSHLPHLSAAALMSVVGTQPQDDEGVLFRLAAGGFRDMTRVAAGHPGIWPSIVEQNRAAVLKALDQYLDRVGHIRELVAAEDLVGLEQLLTQARQARHRLPARRRGGPGELVEVRVPVPDRTGVLAEVTTCLGEAGIGIFDLEISHAAGSARGVLSLLVAEEAAEEALRSLAARSLRPSRHEL
jgi:prephenate dehydrogenase